MTKKPHKVEQHGNDELVRTLDQALEYNERLIRELLRRTASDDAAAGDAVFGLQPGNDEKYAEAARALQKLDPPEDV